VEIRREARASALWIPTPKGLGQLSELPTATYLGFFYWPSCLLALGGNSDLRRTSFSSGASNRAQDFPFGD
jgi:hypothetical protein